ncbi:hypothetical protein EAF04_004384 [Stromatinia cepivora]|nr:hypothetical protein EAF04_004384 [Stromatinia cepivora]
MKKHPALIPVHAIFLVKRALANLIYLEQRRDYEWKVQKKMLASASFLNNPITKSLPEPSKD